jgi:hypothetical protein
MSSNRSTVYWLSRLTAKDEHGVCRDFYRRLQKHGWGSKLDGGQFRIGGDVYFGPGGFFLKIHVCYMQ